MTRAATPLLSLALVAVFTGANRKSTASAAAPLPARHSVVAAGAIARTLSELTPNVASIMAGANDERASALRRLRAGARGTYITEILNERDSSIARWPERAAPLTVWIQPTSRVADFDDDYREAVRVAFEDWDELLLPIRFAFVRDSAHADVHVNWIDRFVEPISGRTRWSRDDDWVITDANITLALHHHGGELLDYEAMHAMALHEIGHLLGLDHTEDTTSVMAPRVRVRSLSDADRATARLVYALPAGPIR